MGLLSMLHVLFCMLLFNAVTCQDACREAQLELGANTRCLQALGNATEVLCSYTCRTVINNYNQLCAGTTSPVIDRFCGNTTGIQNTCRDSQLALVRNVECSQALNNATPGDEVLCGETCYRLLRNYYQDCAGTTLVVGLLCGNGPIVDASNSCHDSQLALVANAECSQVLSNATVTLGDEILCGETCYGLLTNYYQNCAGSTVVVELLCGSNQINSTSTPSTCHESLLQLSRDTKCSQVLTDYPSVYNCEETCFRLVNNYYELCRPTDAIWYKLHCGNNGPIGNIEYTGTDDYTCHNSRVALLTHSECSQALSNAAPGNEVLCGETCYGLLSDFYEHCIRDIQLVNLFCGTYGDTCSNAYDNFYANSICYEPIENDGLGGGILCYNMTCWTLLNNTYTACDFLDARVPEFYCGRGECYEALIAVDVNCSFYDNDALTPTHKACSQYCRARWKDWFNICEFLDDPVTASREFDEACGIDITVPSAAHITRGLQLVSFMLYCLIIALLSF